MNPTSPWDDTHAQLAWDDTGQPLSCAFGDVYFSREDGLAETRHVFLQHNQLAGRFAALQINSDKPAPIFTIAETGFGTGLNFLATWQLWQQTAPKGARLHFISVEKYPLHATDLARALALWPELAPFTQRLLDTYPAITGPASHRLIMDQSVSLTLIVDEASAGLSTLLAATDERWRQECPLIDAWFLDGFAPAKNPDMWSDALFALIGELSTTGTTAATFSAAGIVKRGLRSAGFEVKRVAGFGRKREMVSATKIDQPVSLRPSHKPQLTYARIPAHSPPSNRAIVIGSGISGSHTARALAERGWQVTVLEKNNRIASAASGNPQGLIYAKLSHKPETLPLFNLAALQFSQRAYQNYWHTLHECSLAGAVTGLLQLAYDTKTAEQYPKIVAVLNHPDSLVRWVDAAEASALAGLPLAFGGLHFPGSGWINPPLLCQHLLEHPKIEVKTESDIATLSYNNGHWQPIDNQGHCLGEAPTLIVACAEHSARFSLLEHLPLKPIRGQISYLPATSASRQLKLPLCASGYLAPAADDRHCLGATFNLKETDAMLRQQDHQTNLEHLAELGPAITDAFTDAAPTGGRVAFRCTTPDYLPITGPAPVQSAFLNDYAHLAKDARLTRDITPAYHPGLYLNCGMGSRGLVYAPLCAEILACQITREPLPVSRTLADALNPARFLIRQLIRNR